jgi:cytoskeletal protein CcmA (bactofilin family)
MEDFMVNNPKGDLFVGSGVKMTGTVVAPGLAEIDGAFDGVIKAQSINVTARGVINGTTEAKHIRVEGQVNQTLTAEGTLLIESTGRVNGDISYADLEIRRGGDIQGSITIIK